MTGLMSSLPCSLGRELSSRRGMILGAMSSRWTTSMDTSSRRIVPSLIVSRSD
jgi:hypothetical protein